MLNWNTSWLGIGDTKRGFVPCKEGKAEGLKKSPTRRVMQISNNKLTPATLFLSSTHLGKYSRTPLIRTLVIWIANYPERLGPSYKSVDNLRNWLALKLPAIGSSTVQCYGF